MKKLLKKIGISFAVVLVVLVCLLFVGAAYLFLYPKGELFGIVFASHNNSEVVTIDLDSQVDEIVVNTVKYDINVYPQEIDDNIRVYIKNKISGFAKKDKSTTRLEYNYDDSQNTLMLNLVEPTGLIGAKDSFINVLIPKALMENKISLNLSTKKKSNINLYGNEITKLKDLKISINRGNAYFNGLEVENLYLKADKGDIVAGEKVVGKTEYLELDIGNSKVDLLNAGNGFELLKKEIPESAAINYEVNVVSIRSAEKKSLLRLFNCNKIYTEAGSVVGGGKAILYYVDSINNFNSRNYSFEIYKLANSSVINSSGNGTVFINRCLGSANITTNKGKIEIRNVENTLSLESGSGDINVQNVKKPLSIITKTGKINIDFSEDEHAERVITSLRTHSGNVNINNVDRIMSAVVESGSDMFIKFNSIIYTSSLKLENSNTTIVVPEQKPISAEISTNLELNLQVDVGTVTRQNSKLYKDENFSFVAYATTSSNILKINSLGNLKIFSKDIYELKK